MNTHSNFNVLQTLLNWLKQAEPVWLITVIKTWGSSPTPVGTLMAYTTRFGVVGSLSGGCIEEDLLVKMKSGELLNEITQANKPIQLIYGNNESEQNRFSLPCGGQLHLLIEYLHPTNFVIEHFSSLIHILNNRQRVTRQIDIHNGHLSIENINVQLGIKSTKTLIQHGLGPGYQMLLIGASEVARCVAALAIPLDFKVSVWDHRKEFIRHWQVEGVEIYCGSPEKLICNQFSDQNNAIIALAHDPRVDDIALVDALASNAFYIGAIGSLLTCEKRNKRLANYIDDVCLLNKMHSPVGLNIGSKTPYEIAISILAEVIQERRNLEVSIFN